jgi:hypothetical protein
MPTYNGTATVCTNIARGGSSSSWVASGANEYTAPSQTGIGTYSDYLLFSGFGFSVPTTETIVGVVVNYQIQGQPDTSQTGADISVRLYGAGFTFNGSDRAQPSTIYSNISQTTQTRGGSSDNWNQTPVPLLPATVNNSSWGFGISCQVVAGPVGPIDFLVVKAATVTIYTNPSSIVGSGGTNSSLEVSFMNIAGVTPVNGVKVF